MTKYSRQEFILDNRSLLDDSSNPKEIEFMGKKSNGNGIEISFRPVSAPFWFHILHGVYNITYFSNNTQRQEEFRKLYSVLYKSKISPRDKNYMVLDFITDEELEEWQIDPSK